MSEKSRSVIILHSRLRDSKNGLLLTDCELCGHVAPRRPLAPILWQMPGQGP
jgi:hypothetical protein